MLSITLNCKSCPLKRTGILKEMSVFEPKKLARKVKYSFLLCQSSEFKLRKSFMNIFAILIFFTFHPQKIKKKIENEFF